MHTGPASLLHNHLTIGGGAGRDDRRCRHKKKFNMFSAKHFLRKQKKTRKPSHYSQEIYLRYPQRILTNLPASLYGQLLLLTNASSKCTFLLIRIIFPSLLGEKDKAFCFFLSSLTHPEVDFTGKTAFAGTVSSLPVKQMPYSKPM